MKKKLKNIAYTIILAYCLLTAWLYFSQRSMIFAPDQSRPEAISGTDLVTVKTQDGLLISGFYKPAATQEKPTLLSVSVYELAKKRKKC